MNGGWSGMLFTDSLMLQMKKIELIYLSILKFIIEV